MTYYLIFFSEKNCFLQLCFLLISLLYHCYYTIANPLLQYSSVKNKFPFVANYFPIKRSTLPQNLDSNLDFIPFFQALFPKQNSKRQQAIAYGVLKLLHLRYTSIARHLDFYERTCDA